MIISILILWTLTSIFLGILLGVHIKRRYEVRSRLFELCEEDNEWEKS